MKEKPSDRDRFKSYLRKIGSGAETSREMSREESANALEIMLKGIPSPAQIGAFMIAHRIRRPEPQELAGMIDTYNSLGPTIYSNTKRTNPICFGMPFDGRNKTSPIYPLTSLLLIESGQPVMLHGAGRMPVKYGVTTQELFNALGLNLKGLSIQKVQEGFAQNGLALIYQPDHFPLADTLISFREDIGKRAPIASMELIWTAHKGEHLLVSGFVHPPTESRHIQTLEILDEKNFLMIQGLEGSTDIPISRKSNATFVKGKAINKMRIDPSKYLGNDKEVKFENVTVWRSHAMEALKGAGPFYKSLLWNAGVYFWFAGVVENIDKGIEKAQVSIKSGAAQKTLERLISWRHHQESIDL